MSSYPIFFYTGYSNVAPATNNGKAIRGKYAALNAGLDIGLRLLYITN